MERKRQNQIIEINDMFEIYRKLKILKMECCALKNIDPFAFKDLGNLEELKLSRNKLKYYAKKSLIIENKKFLHYLLL